MKISNFVWLLVVILLIAAASLFYTATNDESSIEETAEQYEVMVPMDLESELSNSLEDAEYPAVLFNNSFEHTVPGEYSEIIVDASGFEMNEFTIVYVRNADTKEWIAAGGQEQRADADGHIRTRFTITQYGNYEVYLTRGVEEFVSPVIVVQ